MDPERRRAASTSAIAITNSATSAVSCFHEVPAKNSTANPIAT